MKNEELNILDKNKLEEELLRCCGSRAWVNKMLAFFPIDGFEKLLKIAEEKWYQCSEKDWKEAFTQHPKIGDIESLKKKFATTANWASREQAGATNASQETLEALAEGNQSYENKFGYIFIVCATGKSAEEMLGMLESRLLNEPKDEIRIAAAEQNKITKIRLEKLFI